MHVIDVKSAWHFVVKSNPASVAAAWSLVRLNTKSQQMETESEPKVKTPVRVYNYPCATSLWWLSPARAPSAAACPSAVSVEASCHGGAALPLGAPLVTAGLSCVRVQLLRPEVVSAVTVRLRRPRDAATVGLSQLMLLGTHALAAATPAAARPASMLTPSEDYVSRTRYAPLVHRVTRTVTTTARLQLMQNLHK